MDLQLSAMSSILTAFSSLGIQQVALAALSETQPVPPATQLAPPTAHPTQSSGEREVQRVAARIPSIKKLEASCSTMGDWGSGERANDPSSPLARDYA